MKVLKFIKSLILGVLGFIFFAFAIVMTVYVLNYNKFGVAEISNHSFLIIKDDISSDNYKKGDLVVVENKKLSQIASGDEIFSYKLESDGSVSITVGLIDETFPEENAISYQNGEYYSMDFVVGKSTKVIPDLGKILSIILNKWGFLFIVVLPIFFIFISQVYALIIEIKYGALDEEEELNKKESKKVEKEEVAKEKPNKDEKPKKIEKEEKAEDKPKKVEKEEENNIDIDFDKLDEEFEKIMSDDV